MGKKTGREKGNGTKEKIKMKI
jgi:hypothetical protein